MNFIPFQLSSTVFNYVANLILAIIHKIATDVFPDVFKATAVKPVLKKPSLAIDALSTYRPISNLSFMSKTLEKTVVNQINLDENNVLVKVLGFKANHSTETTLTRIINDLQFNADSKEVSILVLLYLTATPETIDHTLLIGHLERSAWTGLVFSFLSPWLVLSYLYDRIKKNIGPYEDLLTTTKKRKLKWNGHVTRSTRLAKTILQSTVQGGRRRGRQKKNISEWTGLKMSVALRKAENREGYRELVAVSSVDSLATDE